MSKKEPLDRIFVEPFENSHVWRRRFEMLIFTILNAILAIISIISLVVTEGWQKLTQFPYMALWIYLIVFAFIAFGLMWNRTKEDAKEQEDRDKKLNKLDKLDIPDNLATKEDINKLTVAITDLGDEIRKDRDE